MIAEVYGKISSTGSNLSDRMEDKLTGNVFGNLRYLPYEKGLKILLDKIILHNGDSQEILEKIYNQENSFIADKIKFWPRCKNTRTELDMSINLDELFIGIEVKYESPMSGDDQLLRELKVINDERNKKKGLLLFIAQGNGITEAINSIDKLGEYSYILDNIGFACITWEDIYETFNKLDLEDYNDYEKIILEDIIRLLKHKGFEKFKSFQLDEEYDVQEGFFQFNFELDRNFDFKFDIKIEEDFYEFR